jgi:pimeloyl-ACP methyl ester carboxylesterase
MVLAWRTSNEQSLLMGIRRSYRRALLIATPVVAGLGSLTYARYRPDLDRARVRVETGSRVALTRCGPIEYADHGEGPAVLVVHGAGGGFDQGMDLGEGMARAGFRVIAPSRFGYLRTPLPADASEAAQADAHACLLDALDVRSVAIVGVSAGGSSALQFALRFPERTRALVLLVPAVYAPRPDGEAAVRASRTRMFLFDTALRSDFLFWASRKLAHDAFIRGVLGTPPAVVAGASPSEQARVETALDHILPVSPRRAGLMNDARVISSLARCDLEKIVAPTLAVSAADDGYGTFYDARYTVAHIPGARFVGYPSGGHMLVGRNTAAAAEILAFLRATADN